MKRIVLFIIGLALSLMQANAARIMPATGRVVDQSGQAIEYATVVLLKGSQQVVGMATDVEGRFELKVPVGEYTLSVQYLGFDPLQQQIKVEQANDLGDIVLKNAATQIESVVVKAQLIRREADRFVVDVANAPAAIGKDGMELLERAPGVWLENDKISINGKTGSKVMINDRELKMEASQVVNYLKTLRAEEIQKIEVIPSTGADYDANSAGGVIKITLKKRRENGLDGSLSMRTSQSEIVHQYNPAGNINIHSGKLDLYASAWGYMGTQNNILDEKTRYMNSNAALYAHSTMDNRSKNYGGSAGAIYALNPHHSIGGEINFWHNNEPADNISYTDIKMGNVNTHTDSRYLSTDRRNNYTATFNYIWKIDSLGSTFKLLADYTRQHSNADNDNTSRITIPSATPLDSLYRDHSSALYNIITATLALEKNFTTKWSLKAGAKYTNNDMHNEARYEYQKGSAWVDNEPLNFTINYIEHIAAAYGILSAKLNRWNLVAGLRGEYTHTYGKGGSISQSYLSLFPNVNLSYSLKKDGSYSLITQYARTIERPNFWSLNPQRMQLSDYTYQIGNPNLAPAFKQDLSLTLALKYKYTLTAGMVFQKDEINQTMRPDADDPNRLQLAWVNYDRTTNYYLTANLPFQLFKWWQINANLTYLRVGQRLEEHGKQENFSSYFVNTSTSFTLPAKFYIDLSYRYQSKYTLGNIWIEPMHALHTTLKKQFGEHFTATFTVRNLFDQGQTVGARGDGFVRKVAMKQSWSNRTYQIGITYNFKSGKAFNRKTIEAGSADEKGRL